MNQRLCNLFRLGVLAATIVFLCPAESRAVDGRDFAGFYELENIVDQGARVSLKFSTQIFNHSDADVIGAYVTLDDSLLFENYTSFQNVRIDYRNCVFLSGNITVPAREYQHWLQGAQPNLYVIYQDASGNTLKGLVELIQVLPGVQQ
jgi:hypothetical protein